MPTNRRLQKAAPRKNSNAVQTPSSRANLQAHISLKTEIGTELDVEYKTERLATDGRAVARGTNGKVVFIEGALAPEKVMAKIHFQKKNFAEAIATRIVEPSPDRVTSPCPYAASAQCGGCNLQHLREECQTPSKKQWFLETLARVGQWHPEHIQQMRNILTVHAPVKTGYRQRIRLHFDGLHVGFKKRGSSEIADIEKCLVAHPTLQTHLGSLRKAILSFFASLELQQQQSFKSAEIEFTASGVSGFVAELGRVEANSLASVRSFEKSWATDFSTFFRDTGGSDIDIEHPYAEGFSVHRKSFLQPHREALALYCTELNAGLQNFLTEHVTSLQEQQQREGPLWGWDLYAGSGVFTRLFHTAAKHLSLDFLAVGVEGIAPAIVQLEKNHSAQKMRDAGFAHKGQSSPVVGVCADVEEFLNDFLKTRTQKEKAYNKKTPVAVLLDPPRAGAGLGVMNKLIAALNPTLPPTSPQSPSPVAVAYVACDAASLARDTKLLLDAGFSLTRAALFDCFGHTTHYEVVAFFENKFSTQ